MKRVSVPGDVKPGDLVEFAPYSAFRTPPPIVCKVTSVGKSSLTFDLPDGTTQRKSFTSVYTSRGGYRGRYRWTHYNFSRLDARDRWIRDMPRGLNVTADSARGFVSVVLTADDVRDLVAVTLDNRLKRLADWLAAEPPPGTP